LRNSGLPSRGRRKPLDKGKSSSNKSWSGSAVRKLMRRPPLRKDKRRRLHANGLSKSGCLQRNALRPVLHPHR
jgi:hypothetical protein